jgi:hypothetical protein
VFNSTLEQVVPGDRPKLKSFFSLTINPAIYAWLSQLGEKKEWKTGPRAVLLGDGPLTQAQMQDVLSWRSWRNEPFSDHLEISVVVVGRNRVNKEDLLKLMEWRKPVTGKPIAFFVYSQELLLLYFATGLSLFTRGSSLMNMDTFVKGHKTLEWLAGYFDKELSRQSGYIDYGDLDPIRRFGLKGTGLGYLDYPKKSDEKFLEDLLRQILEVIGRSLMTTISCNAPRFRASL